MSKHPEQKLYFSVFLILSALILIVTLSYFGSKNREKDNNENENVTDNVEAFTTNIRGDEHLTVFIKKYPSKLSTNIGEVKPLDDIKIFGQSEDNSGSTWVKVANDDVIGWIPKSFFLESDRDKIDEKLGVINKGNSKENKDNKNNKGEVENKKKKKKKKISDKNKGKKKEKKKKKKNKGEEKNKKKKSKKGKKRDEKKEEESEKDKVSKKDDKKPKHNKTEKEKEKKKEKPFYDPNKEKKISSEYSPTTDLNIRKGPGIVFDSIGYAIPGQKLNALKSYKNGKTTWYYIERVSDGKKGWVGSGYLNKYSKQKNKTSNSNDPKRSSSKDNSSGSTSYKPNHIYFNGKAVPYKNVGMGGNRAQNVIDTSNYAATFGGAATFSGTDGKNTHFVVHNGGRNQFGGMHTASKFVVTDANGTLFTYYKTRMYVVNEKGIGEDGKNYYDRIVGTGGGERITLQSTRNHPWKYIVESHPK